MAQSRLERVTEENIFALTWSQHGSRVRPSLAHSGLMVALTGTGGLADDIYLLAHHEVSGKPFLQPQAIGLGLAGGLLAELVLIRAIGVSGDGVAATRRVRPQDGLTRAVHSQVLGGLVS